MLTSWRVNKLGKAPIGTYVKKGDKLYIKERGDTPHRGEWYRPWKCIKIDDELIEDGGHVSSVELGFGGYKMQKANKKRVKTCTDLHRLAQTCTDKCRKVAQNTYKMELIRQRKDVKTRQSALKS